MTSLAISVRGPADAALVWQRYVRPELWSTWSPQISSVDCADEVIRWGSTGTVQAVFGVRVPFRVTAFDAAGLRWAWEVRLPLGIRLHLTHSVLQLPDGASTGLRVRGPAPVVLGYLPVARLALRRLVAR